MRTACPAAFLLYARVNRSRPAHKSCASRAAVSARQISLCSASVGTMAAVTQGHRPPDHVIVCGAGIIGASTAYYLANKGIKVTLVERASVACAASGKAGGFLALDWCDGTPVESVTALSYRLHEQLAHSLGRNVGYRKVHTLSMAVQPGHAKPGKGGNHKAPAWVDGRVSRVKEMAGPNTTAQVHPKLLTEALVEAAQQQGAMLRLGEVQGIAHDGGRVQGVTVDGEQVDCDAVVVAMGPWSQRAAKWLPLAVPVTGQKYHSVVLRPEQKISGHCLFLQYQGPSHGGAEPEIYPRDDGTVYVCGEADHLALPDDPNEIPVQAGSIRKLRDVAASVSSMLADAKPLSDDGQPMVGPVPQVKGAYIATGHSCWGILNGPGTGLACAELIADGRASSADISQLDPGRYAHRR